jgi:Flp pilus assembly protein TadD
MWRPVLAVILVVVLAGCGGDNAEKFLQQGAAHFQKHEYDLAIKSYQKAIELEPKNAVAYNLLGMACRFKYNQSGNPDFKQKEIAAFKKAIEINPDFWGAMINLGATYYYRGEKAKAAPLFKKALALNPQNPEKPQLEKMIAEGEGKP